MPTFATLGITVWSFVGLVVAAITVFIAFATVSELVLPLTFVAVLAMGAQSGRYYQSGLRSMIAIVWPVPMTAVPSWVATSGTKRGNEISTA